MDRIGRWATTATMLLVGLGAFATPGKAGPRAETPASPPSYYVAMHEVELSVTTTTALSVEYQEIDKIPTLEALGKCLAAKPAKKNEVEGSISLHPVPDAQVGRIPISTRSSSWTDTEMAINFTPEGFLGGVNVSSTGRGPEVVKAIATTLAQLAGAAVGLGILGVAPPPPPGDPLIVFLERYEAEKNEAIANRFACENIAGRADATYEDVLNGKVAPQKNDCNPLAAPYASMPNRLRWMLGSSPAACRAYGQVLRLGTEAEVAFTNLADARRSFPMDDLARGRAHKLRVDALGQAHDEALARLTGGQKELAALIAERTEALGFAGKKSKSEKLVLAVDRLCSSREGFLAALKNKPELDPICLGSVPAMDKAPVPCDCAAGIWNKKGVSLLASVEPAIQKELTGPPSAPSVAGSRNRSDFYFRQPVPMTFQLIGSERLKGPKFEPPQQHLVLHPRSGLQGVSLDQKAFSKGSLALTFSALGVPSALQVSATSSAAGIAGAIAEGTKTLRDEYKTTLETLVTVREKQRELELADLSDDLARLKKEKELLDADASLEVLEGSYESLVARQLLENDIALLEAQVKLQIAQETLDLKAQTQAMSAEVAKLAQEIEVLKRRLELEELRKK